MRRNRVEPHVCRVLAASGSLVADLEEPPVNNVSVDQLRSAVDALILPRVRVASASG